MSSVFSVSVSGYGFEFGFGFGSVNPGHIFSGLSRGREKSGTVHSKILSYDRGEREGRKRGLRAKAQPRGGQDLKSNDENHEKRREQRYRQTNCIMIHMINYDIIIIIRLTS